MTDAKKLEAKILETKNVFNTASILGPGKEFMKVDLIRIEADAHDGGKRTFNWFMMESGDSVGVLCYDPKRDEVVLIRESRPGIIAAGKDYPYTDNVVAGSLKKGEDPIEAAKREWLEETAGTDELKEPRIIHNAYVSSGRTTEKIAIVFGIGDFSKAGGIAGLKDENEDIRTVVVPYKELMAWVRAGECTDFKTIAACYWLADNRDDLRARYLAPAIPAAGKAPAPGA